MDNTMTREQAIAEAIHFANRAAKHVEGNAQTVQNLTSVAQIYVALAGVLPSGFAKTDTNNW